MKFEVGDKVRQVRKGDFYSTKEAILNPREIVELEEKDKLYFGDTIEVWGVEAKIYYEADKFIPAHTPIKVNKEQLKIAIKELNWIGYDIPSIDTWEGEEIFYILFGEKNVIYLSEQEMHKKPKNIIRFEEVYGDKYPDLCKNKFNYYEV